MTNKICHFIIIFLYFSQAMLWAKIDPPNYDFSIKKFDLFMPGSKKEDIDKQYKFKELTFKNGEFTTYKYYIEHIRYKFPIFVQFKSNIVTDFHARLPQYFLHDIFHQSLINKIGSQDLYKKAEEQAVYIWRNKGDNRHYYSGGCSITCFPIFYAVRSNKNLGNGYQSLIQKFNSQSIKQSKD